MPSCVEQIKLRRVFSKRTPLNLTPNALALALEEFKAKGQAWLDLTVSNPTEAGFSYPAELLQGLSNPRSLAYRPEARGVNLNPIVELWQRRGYAVRAEQIALTVSTSEAYSLLFKLLCDPFDEVLVPRPSYPLLDHLAQFENVVLRDYQLCYDGSWSFDWASIEAALSPKTRAICVVSPNNPTGSYLKHDELERLLSFGLPVICDEVFADYPLTQDARRVTSVVGMREGLFFSLDGLSKTVGLPQMKLGWITVSGAPDNISASMQRLEFMLDAYLSVSTPIQLAAAHFLSVGQIVTNSIRERLLANHAWLRERLRSTSVSLLFAEGGWYATLQLPKIMTDEAWALLLLKDHQILTQPGYFYDFEEEAHLVVSLITPPEIFRSGIERLLSAVSPQC